MSRIIVQSAGNLFSYNDDPKLNIATLVSAIIERVSSLECDFVRGSIGCHGQ